MAGLWLFPVFHHLVGERFGPFNQQVLPVFVGSPSYNGSRQIAFCNQRSAEVLIPNSSVLRGLFVHLVGDHMRLLLMR